MFKTITITAALLLLTTVAGVAHSPSIEGVSAVQHLDTTRCVHFKLYERTTSDEWRGVFNNDGSPKQCAMTYEEGVM